MERRGFLKGCAALAALPGLGWAVEKGRAGQRPYRYCLGQYSLHRTLAGEQGPKLDPLDYPEYAAKTFGLKAVDYWSGPFQDRVRDSAYLNEMAQRAKDAGVEGVLVLVDGAGRIGDPEPKLRQESVEAHIAWLEAAKILGLFAIRVNAHSEGSREEQLKLCADGLSQLCEKAAAMNLSVLVENHGGLSSDGAWVTSLMKAVNKPNFGTLPDFGNFYEYDRYQGVAEMMPWAKLVCAKSRDFNKDGNESGIDYPRMLKIIKDSGYKGWIEIEYEGGGLTEIEGVKATLRLLERNLKP